MNGKLSKKSDQLVKLIEENLEIFQLISYERSNSWKEVKSPFSVIIFTKIQHLFTAIII